MNKTSPKDDNVHYEPKSWRCVSNQNHIVHFHQVFYKWGLTSDTGGATPIPALQNRFKLRRPGWHICQLWNQLFCGTGTLLLLNKDLEVITKFSPIKTFYVESNSDNGWRSLTTEAEGTWKKMIYRNTSYPSNSTTINDNGEAPRSNPIKLFWWRSTPFKIIHLLNEGHMSLVSHNHKVGFWTVF